MKDLSGMLKQAQALQEKLQAAQAEVAELEVEGSSGGGMVRITLSGAGEVKRVELDKSLMDPEEVEVLEDLLVAALNDGKRKAEEASREKMQAAAGGLGGMLPPGFKLPF